MIHQNERAQLNRIGAILFGRLFPEKDASDQIDPSSDLCVICDMLQAAYNIGYADRVREELDIQRPFLCADGYNPVDMGLTNEQIKRMIQRTMENKDFEEGEE